MVDMAEDLLDIEDFAHDGIETAIGTPGFEETVMIALSLVSTHSRHHVTRLEATALLKRYQKRVGISNSEKGTSQGYER
jgi:methyl coenzyme M reductase subunit C